MPPLELSPEEEGLYLPDPSEYEVEAYEPQQYGRGSFFEPLAGLQNLEMPRPQSFGEGLIQGLGRGLGTFGSRAAQRRQMFEQEQTRRQAMNDQERIAASRQLRADTGAGRRALAGARLTSKREQEKFERDNPALTDQDIKANPWLAESGYPVGSRPPERIRAIIAESRVPESPKQKADRERREGVEQRQIDAANRAATASELTANNAKIGNINKLSDDARADPDIKEFPAIRDSYRTGDEAAGRGNSAGDIILMRMIAKATDPTTGVREEEFRTFEGAQGILNRYGVRLTTAMWGGGQLTAPGRGQLRSVLRGIYDRKSAAFGSAYDYHSGRAKRLGYSPEDVVRDYRRAGSGQADGQATEFDYDPKTGNLVPRK